MRALGLLGGAALAALVALVVAVTGIGLGESTARASSGATCRITDPGSGAEPDLLQLDPAQVHNAQIIVGVGVGLGLPARASVIALAAARQESGLHNLNYGDRDSLGLFQMRPSMGWGSPEHLMDPVYAATQFYEHLVGVGNWQELPVSVAAQAVERSAYPNAYAKWEALATALTAALLERGAAKITCISDDAPSARSSSGEWPAERMNSQGLTPRTAYVKNLIENAFDEHDIGGFCPGGCTSGHIPGSDHYTGHAIDVMILPYTDADRVAKGWRIVDWLVANADQLAIKYVIYRARYWSPGTGWEPYHHPSGGSGPTLAHMDHLHVSCW